MLKIKTGVRPRSFVILAAAANAALFMGIEVTITAGTDGKHMTGSKHYTGEAVDIRTSSFASPQELDAFVMHLEGRLPTGYHVIRERDHLHVEFDPA